MVRARRGQRGEGGGGPHDGPRVPRSRPVQPDSATIRRMIVGRRAPSAVCSSCRRVLATSKGVVSAAATCAPPPAGRRPSVPGAALAPPNKVSDARGETVLWATAKTHRARQAACVKRQPKLVPVAGADPRAHRQHPPLQLLVAVPVQRCPRAPPHRNGGRRHMCLSALARRRRPRPRPRREPTQEHTRKGHVAPQRRAQAPP